MQDHPHFSTILILNDIPIANDYISIRIIHMIGTTQQTIEIGVLQCIEMPHQIIDISLNLIQTPLTRILFSIDNIAHSFDFVRWACTQVIVFVGVYSLLRVAINHVGGSDREWRWAITEEGGLGGEGGGVVDGAVEEGWWGWELGLGLGLELGLELLGLLQLLLG